MNSEAASGLISRLQVVEKDPSGPMDCKPPSRTWFLCPYLFGRTPIRCAHIVLVLHIIIYLIEIVMVYVAQSVWIDHKSIGLIFVHDMVRFLGEGSIIMITVMFFILLLIAFVGLQFRQSLFVLPFLTMLMIAQLLYPLLIYQFVNTASFLMQGRSGHVELIECFAIVSNLLFLIMLSFQSSRILLRSMIDMEDEKSKERPEMCNLSLYFNLFT
ncbi:hypothetical protein PRIPAC_76340 [Pristionchus pacificus]|uniref:Uncharacterized protein n=1 Tax=Pristionchus pacificus TaxID=54126 RepID=A0A2A6BET7_PRIPA|nr:hypothetical protein PRIPAC_76340 [Pristionchus pacificus]|eukprot:PDM64399.1 hypothetical protein PRIPAC_52655 [Pristionchus pacificus]